MDYLYFADHGKNSPVYVRTVKNKGASAYDVYKINSPTNNNKWAVLTYLDSYEEFEKFVDSNSLANTGRNSSNLEDLFREWENYYNTYGMSRIKSTSTMDTWTYRDFTAENVTVYTTDSDEIFVVDENNCCLYHSDTGYKGGYSPRPYEGIVSMEPIEKITENDYDVPEPSYKDVIYYALDCNELSYNMSGYQTSWYIMQASGYDTTFNCYETSLLNNGKKFVAWERYNWDTGAWDVVSTEPIAKIGAYKRTYNGETVVAPLRIRMKTEKLPCDIKVSTTDGLSFSFGSEYDLTSANVYAGATIYLNSYITDENGKESYVESYTVKTATDTYQINDSSFQVTEDVEIFPIIQEGYSRTIGVGIRDGEWGHGYFDNEYDDEYYSWAEASIGDKLWVNLVNYDGFDEDRYEFIGWFYCEPEMGDIGDLISTEERFELTVEETDDYISIMPLYMEIGGKDPRAGNVIRVTNGFVRNGRNYHAPLYVSSIVVSNDSNISVKYDPTQTPYATKFIITPDGEEPYEEYREYDEIDIWYVNSDLNIEGVSTDHTEHNWSDWLYNYDDQETHIRSCICGVTETENHIDGDADGVCEICDNDIHTHSFAEQYKFNSKTHWNECSCGQKSNEAAHIDEDGNEECDACGFSAHTHKYELTQEVAPTCTEQGSKTYTCECGSTYSEPIQAPGHRFDLYLFNNDSTCTKDGTLTARCANCDATDTVVVTGSAKGHELGAPVKENVKNATCTAKGSYDEVYYCPNCGDEAFRKAHTTDMLSHQYATKTTKATISKNGSKITACTVCGKQSANSTIYYPKTITLSATSYTYDGKAKKPSVTVKDSNGKAIASSNYTVAYSNNKNVGTATVKITFKGDYSGTVNKTFTINPKGTSLSSLSAVSKGFTAKWKKQATQTTGYEIQYATDSKFKKNAKTVAVTKNSTVSKKITKLTAKKKYFVRIRTYKTVSGKKYYSSWSSSKSVTTKK